MPARASYVIPGGIPEQIPDGLWWKNTTGNIYERIFRKKIERIPVNNSKWIPRTISKLRYGGVSKGSVRRIIGKNSEENSKGNI